MSTILLKVDDKIKNELDAIREQEGLGNQTATVIYLVKYYKLTRENRLEDSLNLLDKILDKVDRKSIPSLEKQLKNL